MRPSSRRIFFCILMRSAVTLRLEALNRCIYDHECCSYDDVVVVIDSPHHVSNDPSSCCGRELSGLRCINGACFRGSKQCWSFRDHPSCNRGELLSDDIDDKDDGTARRRIVSKCREAQVQPSTNQSQRYGEFALHKAVVLGNQRMVEHLLQEGHDVNQPGHGGASPLHMAAMSDVSEHTVEILLQYGADVDSMDDLGYTPLHRFVQSNRIWGATAVLFHGAQVNRAGPGQHTALHMAALENARSIAEVLLAFGANATLVNHERHCPFDLGLFEMLKR